MPHPAESPACPACGSKERTQEDTLAGPTSDRDWALELAAEAVMRALEKRELGRRRTAAACARGFTSSSGSPTAGDVDQRPLHGVGDAAVALACAKGDVAWVRWALSLYATLGQVPPTATCIEHFDAAAQPANDACPGGASRRRKRELAWRSETGGP